MTRYVLDANVILRFLRDDHPEHSPQATGLFAQAASGDCVLAIPSVVLAECVWVLQSFYSTEREAIALALSKLISKPGVETDELELAIDALRRLAKTNIDYVDCYLAARASASGETVASFDKDLQKSDDIQRWEP